MSISVQGELYEYIRERAEKDHFGSVSEYLRWLVRCDQKGKVQTSVRENARTRVRTANESIFISMFEEFLDHYYGEQHPADL
jgi:Arc/MetJ-type ribon-helix-helix transcriptional regulator